MKSWLDKSNITRKISPRKMLRIRVINSLKGFQALIWLDHVQPGIPPIFNTQISRRNKLFISSICKCPTCKQVHSFILVSFRPFILQNSRLSSVKYGTRGLRWRQEVTPSAQRQLLSRADNFWPRYDPGDASPRLLYFSPNGKFSTMTGPTKFPFIVSWTVREVLVRDAGYE